MTAPYLAAVLLFYWAICVILFYGFMLWWIRSCGESDEGPRWKILAEVGSPRRELAIVGAAIVCAFLAPVFVPQGVVFYFRAVLRERAEMLHLRRTHREYVFAPFHPARLRDPARSYFEEKTLELLDLGFSNQGTYVLKPEPCRRVGKCFSGPEGRVIAVLAESFDMPDLSFTTLFENGNVLETAAVDVHSEALKINESQSYRAIAFPDATVAETYARHLEEIDELEASRGTAALAFGEDQFQEILIYEGRAFSREMFAMGKKDAPPPEPVLPAPFP